MAAADRDEIIKYANEYLAVYLFDDYGPQGCQYVGRKKVYKIVSAVSVTAEVIKKAFDLSADMLLTHHGLFWNTEPHIIDSRNAARLNMLTGYGLNLLGYHLCLDAHPEIGNNILAFNALGGYNPTPFGEIGWGGQVKVGNMGEFLARVTQTYQSVVLHNYSHVVKAPKKFAVVTGGGSNYIHLAAKEGYDLLLTGEPAEPSKALAKELGISFIAAGHYVTEKDGIKALGEKLAKEFDIKHEFIDVVNYV